MGGLQFISTLYVREIPTICTLFLINLLQLIIFINCKWVVHPVAVHIYTQTVHRQHKYYINEKKCASFLVSPSICITMHGSKIVKFYQLSEFIDRCFIREIPLYRVHPIIYYGVHPGDLNLFLGM
jgi:hypothetical protein